MKRKELTKEILTEHIPTSVTMSDFCRKFNIMCDNHTRKYVKKLCMDFGISIIHFNQRISNYYTIDEFIEAVKVCGNYTQICHKLGLTVCTYNFKNIASKIQELNLTSFIDVPKKNYKTIITVEAVMDCIKDCYCVSDICKKLFVPTYKHIYKFIHNLCIDNDIDISHFDVRQTYTRNKKQIMYEEVFRTNSTVCRSSVRLLAIRFGLYTGKCAECGCADTYNGKPLIIELDHINGLCNDNRLENLRWLCPNCHSQTSTYRRRVKKRI